MINNRSDIPEHQLIESKLRELMQDDFLENTSVILVACTDDKKNGTYTIMGNGCCLCAIGALSLHIKENNIRHTDDEG